MLTSEPSTADELIAIIQSHLQQNIALVLSKSYYGVVLNQVVSVYEVSPDRITFLFTNSKHCASLEGSVHLHSPLLSRPLTARLSYLNLGKSMVALSDFDYLESDWKERRHERVKPKNAVYVTVHQKRSSFKAALQNISVGGMGLLVHQEPEQTRFILPNANLQLDFRLPPDRLFKSLRGKVVFSHAVMDSWLEMGIQFTPRPGETRLLEGYILSRKEEIMSALDQAYSVLSQPRDTASLFF